MRIIHCQRGVAALEFALVLPFLLLITFIIIEFGFILYDKAVLTNATREGARAGVVYITDEEGAYTPKEESDIKPVVQQYADPILINLGGDTTEIPSASINVFCKPPDSTAWTSGACNDRGYDLKVQVSYIYDFLVIPNLFSIIGSDFDGTVTINSETIMRME